MEENVDYKKDSNEHLIINKGDTKWYNLPQTNHPLLSKIKDFASTKREKKMTSRGFDCNYNIPLEKYFTYFIKKWNINFDDIHIEYWILLLHPESITNYLSLNVEQYQKRLLNGLIVCAEYVKYTYHEKDKMNKFLSIYEKIKQKLILEESINNNIKNI